MIEEWSKYGALVEWYWSGKTEVLKEKTCPSVTLSATNTTWAGLHLNPSIPGQRLNIWAMHGP